MSTKKRFLVISHVTETYGGLTFAFLNHLKKFYRDFDYMLHPLAETAVRESIFVSVSGDKNVRVYRKEYHAPATTSSYVSHLVISLIWLLKNDVHYEFCFGFNNLNTFVGLLLRMMHRVDVVVYYTVDYSPTRFKNRWLNRAYHLLDGFCVRHSDYVFSVSERTRSVRRAQGLPESKNILQPNGVELEHIRCHEDKIPKTIFYVGHLTKSKGVDLVIKAIKTLDDSEVKFFIYGDGPYKGELIQLTVDLGLTEQVFFLGGKDNSEILREIGKYQIGVAFYTSNDDFNFYCDPVKVKEYLAVGCPVIMSDIPEIAGAVEKEKMGIVIRNNDVTAIADGIRRLLHDRKLYDAAVKRGLEFAESYDWDLLFANSLKMVMA